MSTEVGETVEVDIENVGGIDRTSVRFEPGVTILSGRNATNRTSLLQGIMAAHGSDRATLKADAQTGTVELVTEEGAYETHLSRENGVVTTGGTPFVADTEVADLFAFLLQDNNARRAVERGDDLRDLIMRPVDVEVIESEIRELEDEKERLDEEIEELEELERQLPNLETKRTELKGDLESKRSELETKQAELEQADASVDEKRQAKAEFEAKFDELCETKSTLEDVRYELETERDTLESLQEERSNVESEYDALPQTPAGDITMIEDRLDGLHERKQSLTADLNQLQTILQFNEEMLDSTDTGLLESLDDGRSETEAGSVTDQLVDDAHRVTCWTCGSTVEEDTIDEMLDELRDFRQRKLQDRRELDSEIDDLQTEKRELETQQRQREQLEGKLDEYDDQLDRSKATIEELEAREAELEEEVTTLEKTVSDLEQEEQSDLLDRQKEVNQLEFEVGRLEGDLDDVDSKIESIESQLDDRESLQRRREKLQDELGELRTRVDRLEEAAVDEFNDHMAVILEELGFENLERVWIEQSEEVVRDGRRKVSKGTFDLHVVRETDGGTVYEDTVDHLSESEREVVGLVFALSGYLVHDVHESVPFMLLDSLEALDAARIAALVDHFSDYADYLIVVLLPEDAAAVDEDYPRIREI